MEMNAPTVPASTGIVAKIHAPMAARHATKTIQAMPTAFVKMSNRAKIPTVAAPTKGRPRAPLTALATDRMPAGITPPEPNARAQPAQTMMFTRPGPATEAEPAETPRSLTVETLSVKTRRVVPPARMTATAPAPPGATATLARR